MNHLIRFDVEIRGFEIREQPKERESAVTIIDWSTDFSNAPDGQLLVTFKYGPDGTSRRTDLATLKDGFWCWWSRDTGEWNRWPGEAIAWAMPVQPYDKLVTSAHSAIATIAENLIFRQSKLEQELTRRKEKEDLDWGQCVAVHTAAVDAWTALGEPQNTAEHVSVLRAQSWLLWMDLARGFEEASTFHKAYSETYLDILKALKRMRGPE